MAVVVGSWVGTKLSQTGPLYRTALTDCDRIIGLLNLLVGLSQIHYPHFSVIPTPPQIKVIYSNSLLRYVLSFQFLWPYLVHLWFRLTPWTYRLQPNKTRVGGRWLAVGGNRRPMGQCRLLCKYINICSILNMLDIGLVCLHSNIQWHDYGPLETTPTLQAVDPLFSQTFSWTNLIQSAPVWDE